MKDYLAATVTRLTLAQEEAEADATATEASANDAEHNYERKHALQASTTVSLADLQVTASRLHGTMRASDFVARLGGDEFVVVLPETGEAPTIASVIERIEQQLRIAPIGQLANGMVTASIGQAFFPRDGHDLAGLLAVADRAMYRAKVSRRQIHTKDAPPQWIGGCSRGVALSRE